MHKKQPKELPPATIRELRKNDALALAQLIYDVYIEQRNKALVPLENTHQQRAKLKRKE